MCWIWGRLLGFSSKYPLGTYIGCEPNKTTFNELLELRDIIISNSDVKKEQIKLYNCKWEDFKYNGDYDLVFTSIPYYDTEIYYNQSEYFTYNDIDDWKNTFISTFYNYKNVFINMDMNTYDKLNLDSDILYKLSNNTSHFNKNTKTKCELIVKI